MGSTDYEFRTVWRVAGTPEEVAAVLGDATAMPRWWPSVYLSVEPVAGGPEPGPGMPRPVRLSHEGLAALYAPLDPHGYGARHGPRLRPHRGRRSERHRPLDLRAGRAGNGHHLRLARQRRQAPAAAAELAAEAGLRRQPPLGDGPRPGEPRPGTAPAPRGSGGHLGAHGGRVSGCPAAPSAHLCLADPPRSPHGHVPGRLASGVLPGVLPGLRPWTSGPGLVHNSKSVSHSLDH